jgi:lactoylglutathione lyase
MNYAHVCYRINEIDRSIEFYCGALGFKELKRYPIRDEAVNIYVAPEGSENTPLELTFNFGRTEDYDIGTGYGHIAYHVEDLDGTLARLAEIGVQPEKPPYSIREGGSRLCFVRDPDGYRIELIEKVAGD